MGTDSLKALSFANAHLPRKNTGSWNQHISIPYFSRLGIVLNISLYRYKSTLSRAMGICNYSLQTFVFTILITKFSRNCTFIGVK